MKKILITLDYELFFGVSGTARNCIVKPTNKLLEILDRHEIKATFFVDSGYLIKLKEHMNACVGLQEKYQLVSSQIHRLSNEGHDIELHIHPHWEDTTFDGKNWVFNMSRYKLSDFSSAEIDSIVMQYSEVLEDITNIKPSVYRAGGWCIQPFDKIGEALYKNGIRVDSTVYPGGKNETPSKSFDFASSPDKNSWRFSVNPLIEDAEGRFIEIPISSVNTSPFFYFKFILHKIFSGKKHKQFGDGRAISNSNTQIFGLLSRPSCSVASIDGYKASLLDKAARENKEQLVLIGHPKALTPYSLMKLDEFIQNNKDNCIFRLYSNYNE